MLVVEIGFYVVTPVHDLRAERLGQGENLLIHYARNRPELLEGGDTRAKTLNSFVGVA